MRMLMQTNRLVASLVMVGGILGVRFASAQATAEQNIVEQRNADEKTAQRQAEIEQLRAQQQQIKAQLDLLEAEKQELQHVLEQNREQGGTTPKNAAAIYRRVMAQRQQAIAQVRDAEAAELSARAAAQQADADRDQGAKEQERQAWRKWNEDRIARDKAGGNEFAGRGQLDLVSLADRYVDAKGNLELAELELEQLARKGGGDHPDMVLKGPALKLKVQTAKRRLVIFRGIAEAAMEAAKSDLDLAMQQVKGGLAPQGVVTEARSRVRILEVILAQ
jgi:hypothetical protein